ncbi:MAG: uroporphyrinogen-III C-methyltransferase [Burkholderiales bacterium]|jgi:uroporphyrin-III C-methyltransferase/precorrin-2 dehydrogenase/sirohydrochlorin ferrochelatase|nr:uroporphyrinogen-III C-methyltransferase [Burkholderiales bacterium]
MNILPIAVTPKKILLIGAGRVAAQKAKVILESDSSLTVMATSIRDPYFHHLPVVLKAFDQEDLKGADAFDVVINATGDLSLSQWLWNHRKHYRYWLNCVDVPEYCDFYFGATYRNHDLCVSVSTGGASPSYAQKIRDVIKLCVPELPKSFYQTLRNKRAKVAPFAPQTPKGEKVYLIGCGPGHVKHLTLAAIRALPTLNVALIDGLVGKSVVDLLPADCIKISVGKEKGHATKTQEEINALLLNYARQGYTVGRLKGGDPSIFARMFDEASMLARHHINVDIINGVSSMLAGAVASGIPVTLRDVASGALVVSAHLRGGRFNDDWMSVVRSKPYTVIVLMAMSFAREIQQSAIDHQVALSTPCAFVSKIGSDKEKSVIGTLASLTEMAAACEKPSILVIGDAVEAAAQMPYHGERVFWCQDFRNQVFAQK